MFELFIVLGATPLAGGVVRAYEAGLAHSFILSLCLFFSVQWRALPGPPFLTGMRNGAPRHRGRRKLRRADYSSSGVAVS